MPSYSTESLGFRVLPGSVPEPRRAQEKQPLRSSRELLCVVSSSLCGLASQVERLIQPSASLAHHRQRAGPRRRRRSNSSIRQCRSSFVGEVDSIRGRQSKCSQEAVGKREYRSRRRAVPSRGLLRGGSGGGAEVQGQGRVHAAARSFSLSLSDGLPSSASPPTG